MVVMSWSTHARLIQPEREIPAAFAILSIWASRSSGIETLICSPIAGRPVRVT